MRADSKPLESNNTFRGDSLRVRVYREVLEKLQRGVIGANDRLVDVALAASLGVSRMPVREALMQLTHEGYLVGTSRGFMVATLTPDEVADIYEVRRLLEPRAAANAARDLSASAHEELAVALREAHTALQSGDASVMAQANSKFRGAWLSDLRNRRLAETIARFADHVQIVRHGTLAHVEVQRVVVNGLQQLFDAFSRRDPLAVHDRMLNFITRAEESYFAGQDKPGPNMAPFAPQNS
jgi:DNA-binding GntR family transcriptional regulator